MLQGCMRIQCMCSIYIPAVFLCLISFLHFFSPELIQKLKKQEKLREDEEKQGKEEDEESD